MVRRRFPVASSGFPRIGGHPTASCRSRTRWTICARSHSGSWTTSLVETFVRTGAEMLDFVEAHSELQFEIAEGFPDYKPELPGGRPAGGRSLNAKPFDLSRLGEWSDRITSFPADFSNVGIDAETRARIHASVDNESGDYCVAGTALIAGLLKGLLDVGVVPRTNARAVELIADPLGITGVRITHGRQGIPRSRPVAASCWAPAGSSGTPSWSRRICAAPCAARCHRRTTPATGCAWRWHTAPTWPTWAKRGGCRSCSCPATPSRVSRAAAASDSNEPAREASSSTGQASGSSTRPANTTRWRARSISSTHATGTRTIRPGSSSTRSISSVTASSGWLPEEEAPDWFSPSADLAELGEKTGIDADGLARTLAAWNDNVAHEHDPDFGRGSSAYDGYWGDDKATTTAGKTLGPIDTAPYYAVPVSIGAMGTKGGPRTDRDGRVLHVSGAAIPGLFAAGNAMAGATGKAYGGAGGTLGPAMVFGYRAGLAVSARVPSRAPSPREQTQNCPSPGVSGQLCVCSPGISRRWTSRRNSCPTGTRL